MRGWAVHFVKLCYCMRGRASHNSFWCSHIHTFFFHIHMCFCLHRYIHFTFQHILTFTHIYLHFHTYVFFILTYLHSNSHTYCILSLSHISVFFFAIHYFLFKGLLQPKMKIVNHLLITFLFFFPYKKYSRSFIMLRLNHWWQMEYSDHVFYTFLGLDSVNCLAVNVTVTSLPVFIQNILNCVLKMNEAFTGLEHGGKWLMTKCSFWGGVSL